MQSRAVELLVGFFVCLGIAAILILTWRVSDLANTSDVDGYTVTAAFTDIGGLKVGAPVDLAGVRIGRVTDIELNMTTFQADASIRISDEYKIPKDSSASILTAGLLGDQYVGIGPGGALDNMKDGDKFVITQSAIVLENLIGQFMTSMGDSGSDSGSSDSDQGDNLFGPANDQNSQQGDTGSAQTPAAAGAAN